MAGVIARDEIVPTLVLGIEKTLADHGLKEDPSTIESKVREMLDYRVPPEEAKRSVAGYFLKQKGIKLKSKGENGDARTVKISEIVKPKMWVSVQARVVQLWESRSEKIFQKGLLEDDTGSIGFTSWKSADLPEMELDACYTIKTAVSSEFNSRFSLDFNSKTSIEPLNIEIEGAKPVDVMGNIVVIQKNSGLVKRCPICKKVMDRSECKQHGRQKDGIEDLRISAILDTGDELFTVIADKAATEKIMGFTITEAKSLVQETLDMESIVDAIKDKLLGRYFCVTGQKNMSYIMVSGMTPIKPRMSKIAVLRDQLEMI